MDKHAEFATLLSQARGTDETSSRTALGELIDRYSRDLRPRAAQRLGTNLAGAVSSNDLLQDLAIKAVRGFPHFTGSCELEWKAWMRTLFDCAIADTFRHHFREMRDRRRNQHLPGNSGRDSSDQGDFAAMQSSPSHRAMQDEIEEQLDRALQTLSPDERTAVCLHVCHGWSYEEIRPTVARPSAAAVGALAYRGLKRLRPFFEAEP